MQAAGYPTSYEGMISATAKAITDDPTIYELDNDPMETIIAIITPQLSTYPYKYRITLPINPPRPTAYFSRQAGKQLGQPLFQKPTFRPTFTTTSVNASYNGSLP